MTYHEIGTDRMTLAGLDLLHTQFCTLVIVACLVSDSPTHISYLQNELKIKFQNREHLKDTFLLNWIHYTLGANKKAV